MDSDAAPQEIVELFKEKRHLQTKRRELREVNIKAKDLYGDVNIDERIVKLQLAQKFLNKIKASKPMDRESILKEIDTFNLTRYLNEISISIGDQPITDADVWFFVEVCSKLHQSYEDFAETVSTRIIKMIRSGVEAKEKDEKVIAARKKDLMRLLLELFVVGLPIPTEKVFEILRETIVQPKPRDLILNITTAIMFGKLFNFEVLRKRGVTLSRMYNNHDELDSIFEYDAFVPHDKIVKFMFGLQLYMNQLKDQLKVFYDAKVKEEKRILFLSSLDEVTEKDQNRYYGANSTYVQMLESVRTIADYLELDLDVMFGNVDLQKKRAQEKEEQRQKDLEEQARLREEAENVFGSNDERAFYEDLFDLKLKLPEKLFNQDAKLYGSDEAEESKQPTPNLKATATSAVSIDTPLNPDQIPLSFEEFEVNLVRCINQESADILAEQFMYINTAENRRFLCQNLSTYKREYTYNLPYLSRFISVINLHFPELGEQLIIWLNQAYDKVREVPKQDSAVIQKKIYYLRFLGELAKFRVLELFKILNSIKLLIDDFNPRQIDVLQALLSTVGSFIYNNEETCFRFKKTLEVLTTTVDSQVDTLPIQKVSSLKLAISRCSQGKTVYAQQDKTKSELENFLNFLIHQKLTAVSLSDVSNALNNLSWTQEIEDLCLTAILERAFNRNDEKLIVGLLVNVKKPTLLAKIIDELVDVIIHQRESTKMLNASKFLGELQERSLVSIQFILKTLNALLECADVNADDIRTVCGILEPVRVFASKPADANLLRFLIYLQRFVLSQPNTPADIDELVQETFETLDGGSTRLSKLKTLKNVQELITIIETKETSGEQFEIEDELKVFIGRLLKQEMAAKAQ